MFSVASQNEQTQSKNTGSQQNNQQRRNTERTVSPLITYLSKIFIKFPISEERQYAKSGYYWAKDRHINFIKFTITVISKRATSIKEGWRKNTSKIL
jgi:hypothetical protein